jgi:hypothetical protein
VRWSVLPRPRFVFLALGLEGALSESGTAKAAGPARGSSQKASFSSRLEDRRHSTAVSISWSSPRTCRSVLAAAGSRFLGCGCIIASEDKTAFFQLAPREVATHGADLSQTCTRS